MKYPRKTFTEKDMPPNLCLSLCAGLCLSQKSCSRIQFVAFCRKQTHTTQKILPPPPTNTQNCERGFTLELTKKKKRISCTHRQKNFLYMWSPILDTMHSWKFYHKADHQKRKLRLCLPLSLNKHLLNVHYVPGTVISSAHVPLA